MRAPSPAVPFVSPTEDKILFVSWQDFPSISRVALPYLRLAGVRVEPGNHSRHDTPGGYGITPCARSFALTHLPEVLLPHEPHWYTAFESNEQLLYEEVRWFDQYVKNAPAREQSTH